MEFLEILAAPVALDHELQFHALAVLAHADLELFGLEMGMVELLETGLKGSGHFL